MKLKNDVYDWLDQFYKSLFPDADIQRINGEGILQGEMQKAGIDLVIRCNETGHSFYVDEKIRKEYYPDILLEEYSKWEEKKPDWLEQNNLTDFISYVVVPRRLIYFLPYPILRLAYLKNKDIWINRYGRKFAPNKNYSTSNIPVPWEELKEAMAKIMQQYEVNYETASNQDNRAGA